MPAKIKSILTKREIKYLTDLLNREAVDFSKKYPNELYDIQEKLGLFPRKDRTFCPICQKTMISTMSIRRGKVHCDKFSCSKKCQKILDTWRYIIP